MGILKKVKRQQIGELRERITLQTQTATRNDFGEKEITFVNFATGIYASKREVSGSEAVKAETIEAARKVVFRIRWRAAVNEKMIVVHRNIKYDIEAITEIEPRRFQDLICKKRD